MTQIPEQTSTPTVRQQITANIQHVRTQQATMLLQKQQAEAAVESLKASIAQSEGAIAAYEETLRLLPPDPVVSLVSPVLEKPAPEPPVPAASPVVLPPPISDEDYRDSDGG